jgi:hypothetical protein
MPFDPNLPADNSLVVAAELRSQLNALKALLDALPTHADLNNLRNELLNNSAAPVTNVEELNIPLSEPLSQSEGLQMLDKLNEVLTTLKRP